MEKKSWLSPEENEGGMQDTFFPESDEELGREVRKKEDEVKVKRGSEKTVRKKGKNECCTQIMKTGRTHYLFNFLLA